jgi:hypothetical protein
VSICVKSLKSLSLKFTHFFTYKSAPLFLDLGTCMNLMSWNNAVKSFAMVDILSRLTFQGLEHLFIM